MFSLALRSSVQLSLRFSRRSLLPHLSGEENADGKGVGGVDVVRDWLPAAAHASKLELLVGVGGVVGPLPSEDVDEDNKVLDGERDVQDADVLEVVLDEVRVVELREAVVVAVVVLNVPSLWHHPVEPAMSEANREKG